MGGPGSGAKKRSIVVDDGGEDSKGKKIDGEPPRRRDRSKRERSKFLIAPPSRLAEGQRTPSSGLSR